MSFSARRMPPKCNKLGCVLQDCYIAKRAEHRQSPICRASCLELSDDICVAKKDESVIKWTARTGPPHSTFGLIFTNTGKGKLE
jgi:hypothetical protein